MSDRKLKRKYWVSWGWAAWCMLCLFQSCRTSPGSNPDALFSLMEGTGIRFTNQVKDNDTINILNYRNFYNGGGAAIGDINNDGLSDVFFTANQGPNKLFLNKGQWIFEDISEKAGFGDKQQFSTGVVMADVNGDGWLDIFVCNAGNMHDPHLRSNQLFINNHDLTFTERAAEYGLADSGYTTQVSFFDFDLDGDLDCFKIDNSPVPVNSLGYPHQRDLPASQWNVPDNLKGGGDHLYRNDNGHFTEITQQAGIHGTLMSFGLGVSIGDVNGDYYPDIFVSNDFFEKDYLYINQRDGTFRDEMEQWMQHNSYASMGSDIGDINNDGSEDIFTTDMLPADDYRLKTTLRFDNIDYYRLRSENGFYHQFLQNTLQLNDRDGHLKDIANYSGVNASEWSWGALMFDADNDGLTDLYVCNGIYRDLTNQDFLDFEADKIKTEMMESGKPDLTALVNRIPSIAVPNKIFRNLGNLKFADMSESWGFNRNSFSNGAAYGDLDNDGDLDIVVNNVNEPAFVFRNNSREKNKNHFVGVRLAGKGLNRFAVGSTIRVFKDGQVRSRELIPSRGFQSSVDYKQVIGIGDWPSVDSIIVVWPDLTFSKITNPAINEYLDISQPDQADRYVIEPKKKNATWLHEMPSAFDKHVDDGYTDFYNERAIPQMLSKDGPKGAAADVNGDGLDDVFIGGTVSRPGQLYLQLPDGTFRKKEEAVFSGLAGFVDGAVLFFDCDGDRDMDLLLCSGGNSAAPGSRELQHRLFVNDGQGNFSLSPDAFPVNTDNISTAIANDFDGDGDLDLFVGARCVTGIYGKTPRSHIYLNNGHGIFSDMPDDKIRGIFDAGMVTSAIWADMNGDQKKDLVIAGEWMGPKIFEYHNGSFSEWKTNLQDLKGWWLAVTADDLDGDGKQDLVLGNFGENFYLHPDAEHPVRIWMNDFDLNGQEDKIITRRIDGKDKPVFMKNETESELPVLKKQNLRHSDYATRSIQDIFTPEQLRQTTMKEINYSSSCIAYNLGNGQFRVEKLPVDLQLSSIKAIWSADLNGDGKPDLVTGGNEFTFQPQLGRLDASFGTVLLNAGQQQFQALEPGESGLDLPGQIRDIVAIGSKNRKYLLFLRNNDFPVLYQWDHLP